MSVLAQRRAYSRLARALEEKNGWYHSFEFPDGSRIEGMNAIEALRERWSHLPLPSDLSGKTVLDIGAWDGWFSFEAERRGAKVTAVDCVELANFLHVRERLGSGVDYRICDVYELADAGLGTFDYVLFLGILYHLKHPLLGLEIVCGLTREAAIVESFVCEHDGEIPTMEFYETSELGGNLDNWVGPSASCVAALCRAAGFARVEVLHRTGDQLQAACYRKWEPAEETGPAPQLLSAVHNRNLGINFYKRKEEYISWWFTYPGEVHDVRAEVDGWGLPVLSLTPGEGGSWLLNTRVPPGLKPGWKTARLRVARSPYSNARRIAVDIPPSSEGLTVHGLCDGETWEKGEAREFLSCWISGLAENADTANLRLHWGGRRLELVFVSEPEANGVRQVNARVPRDLPPGEHPFRAAFGPAVSPFVRCRRT